MAAVRSVHDLKQGAWLGIGNDQILVEVRAVADTVRSALERYHCCVTDMQARCNAIFQGVINRGICWIKGGGGSWRFRGVGGRRC